ncbi:F-box domain-containing protein [Entamoeba marina]
MCDSHKSIISKQLELSLLFTVSKYLAFETDYINLTLTSKKNKLLLESFTYNPIPSTRLFHNLQTQYLYSSEDEPVRGVKLLVYCYPISYNFYYEMNGNRIQFKKK